MTSNVSFTVRPPPRGFDTDTPEQSRPGSASPSDLDSLPPTTKPKGKRQWESYTADSSDEDEEDTKEMITGFDAMGVRRSDGKSAKPAGPLVIPSQKNRDWHAVSMARKRQQMYVPEGAKVGTGADGSQGGLGTRGKINDGPQLSGLVVTKREEVDGDVKMEEVTEVEVEVKQEIKEEEPMDEDQRALQALLRGEQGEEKRREIAAIAVQDALGVWAQPKTEADAFKEDLATRPEEASLADYDRVPIELFGEAMLRGMGMGKPTKKMIQPYIPEARPALLGIGAKPRPADEVDQGKGKKFAKPDKRYVPILKVERNGSGQSSRRTSRSRSGSPSRGSSRRDRDSDRRDRDRRDKDYDRRDRDYDRDKRRDRDYDREKRRDYDSDRDREKRKEYDDDRGSMRRDYDDDRDRRRDDSRDRRRDRDRDDRRDRDRDRRR